jgi:hypothetical protein
MFTESDVYWFRRLLAGMSTEDGLETASEPARRVIGQLSDIPVEARQQAFKGVLAMLPGDQGKGLLASLLAIDLNGPAPSPGPLEEELRPCTLADFRREGGEAEFVWPGWIIRNHINLFSSEPKIGKTRILVEISKRVWSGGTWPDGQPIADDTKGRKFLWVPADAHHGDLRTYAASFGLPDDAMLFNSVPRNKYGGIDLDEPETMDMLRKLVKATRPVLVPIDTFWRATKKQLHKPEDVNALANPLLDIAREFDTTFIFIMHLSTNDETLGRRLEGVARSIIKLKQPEESVNRRRLEVKGNFQPTDPLGLTMYDTYHEYDHSPPGGDGERKVGGRPPKKRKEAREFILRKLKDGDAALKDLVDEWKAKGNSKATLFDARNDLEGEGKLVTDKESHPMMLHMVKE